ncbi:cytochrome P450 9e2-like [Microplitis demolitor]|uniref:cytochrome P450 9e2-like n=1 Tax=Microplitis demolitor TaxID=69319 RepID=UPI0004CD46E8|nr:cytochrome P450 9e2-like [Microplitis demolitor]
MGKIIFRRATGVDLINDTYNYNSEAKFVGFFNFTSPMILIRDLELIKSITVKNFDHFVDHKSLSDPEMDPLFGSNLFSLSGDRWRQIRTLLSPAFTSSKMKGMFKLMSECASNFSDFLVGQVQNNLIEFNSKDIFTRYTNDDDLNTSAYLPFGLGPRMCIGNRFALLEIKVLFFYLLAKCNIKISDKMILPMRFCKSSITLMAEGGF